MRDGFVSVKLLGQDVRKEGDLPLVSQTRWIYPSRGDKPDAGRVPFYLDPNFKTYPELVKDFARNALDRLKRRDRP